MGYVSELREASHEPILNVLASILDIFERSDDERFKDQVYKMLNKFPRPALSEMNARKAADFCHSTRAARNKAFSGMDIFGEPSWDMLLDLYQAYAQGQSISVSSVCIASRVPKTTALRWLGQLEKFGLVGRTDDPFDGRRTFVSLTDEAAKRMDATMAGAAAFR
jgi:DNA-binding MarR family transcriptional regulator